MEYNKERNCKLTAQDSKDQSTNRPFLYHNLPAEPSLTLNNDYKRMALDNLNCVEFRARFRVCLRKTSSIPVQSNWNTVNLVAEPAFLLDCAAERKHWKALIVLYLMFSYFLSCMANDGVRSKVDQLSKNSKLIFNILDSIFSELFHGKVV